MHDKILVAVVDRYSMVNEGMCNILKRLGFNVTVQAKSEFDFFRQIEASKSIPNVCLIDIDQPIIEDFFLAKKIRAKHPHIRLVGYSVWDDELDHKNILEYGIDVYAEKSCGPKEVKKIIENLIVF